MCALSQKPKTDPLGSGVQDYCKHVGGTFSKRKRKRKRGDYNVL
jgi:hypothetical protein